MKKVILIVALLGMGIATSCADAAGPFGTTYASGTSSITHVIAAPGNDIVVNVTEIIPVTEDIVVSYWRYNISSGTWKRLNNKGDTPAAADSLTVREGNIQVSDFRCNLIHITRAVATEVDINEYQ